MSDSDFSCERLEALLEDYYLESEVTNHFMTQVLIIISLVCYSLGIIFIEIVPGIQEHPMKMIQWLYAASFSFMWVILIAPFSCEPLHFNVLYDKTIFADLNTSESTHRLLQLNFFWMTYLYCLVSMLNLALSVDLILTLRRPFQKPESRYSLYLIPSIIVPIIPAAVRVAFINVNDHYYGIIVIGFFCVEILAAFLSIVYAVWFKCQRDASPSVFKKILYRHVSYITVSMLCQYHYIAGLFVLRKHDGGSKMDDNWKPHIPMVVLFFGQGFFLSLVRLTEVSFCKAIWQHFCNKKAQPRSQNINVWR